MAHFNMNMDMFMLKWAIKYVNLFFILNSNGCLVTP